MRFQKTRYIPKNALPIEEPGLGVVYVYPLAGKFGVIAYHEKAYRPAFHYTFRKEADMDRDIEAFFRGIREHKKLVLDRRGQDFAGHNFNVGDIVTNSWGYDQANVDWYIVKRTTKNYVWLQSVASELITDEGCGPMSGRESLSLDENLKPIESDTPVTKHRASKDYVTMKHGCGSKWTGEKKYSSWYA